LGEQLGAALTGILVGAAEGDDEVRAHAAVCTLAVRLAELATNEGEDEATARMEEVGEITGGDMEVLADLMCRAADES
jgi:hypothetical protein